MEIDHRFNTVKLLSSAVAVETAAEVVVRGQCPLIALLAVTVQVGRNAGVVTFDVDGERADVPVTAGSLQPAPLSRPACPRSESGQGMGREPVGPDCG